MRVSLLLAACVAVCGGGVAHAQFAANIVAAQQQQKLQPAYGLKSGGSNKVPDPAAAAFASPFNHIVPSTLAGLMATTARALRAAVVATDKAGNGTHITVGPATIGTYTSYANMRRDLTYLENNVCGSILDVVDFGRSVEGRNIMYARVSGTVLVCAAESNR